jgi:hypothetical protein
MAEQALRKKLKLKALALASLRRTIVRQRSRLLHMAVGDANKNFFSLSCITSLQQKVHPFSI